MSEHWATERIRTLAPAVEQIEQLKAEIARLQNPDRDVSSEGWVKGEERVELLIAGDGLCHVPPELMRQLFGRLGFEPVS